MKNRTIIVFVIGVFMLAAGSALAAPVSQTSEIRVQQVMPVQPGAVKTAPATPQYQIQKQVMPVMKSAINIEGGIAIPKRIVYTEYKTSPSNYGEVADTRSYTLNFESGVLSNIQETYFGGSYEYDFTYLNNKATKIVKKSIPSNNVEGIVVYSYDGPSGKLSTEKDYDGPMSDVDPTVNLIGWYDYGYNQGIRYGSKTSKSSSGTYQKNADWNEVSTFNTDGLPNYLTVNDRPNTIPLSDRVAIAYGNDGSVESIDENQDAVLSVAGQTQDHATPINRFSQITYENGMPKKMSIFEDNKLAYVVQAEDVDAVGRVLKEATYVCKDKPQCLKWRETTFEYEYFALKPLSPPLFTVISNLAKYESLLFLGQPTLLFGSDGVGLYQWMKGF